MKFTGMVSPEIIHSGLQAIFGSEFFGVVSTGNEIEPQIGGFDPGGAFVLRELTAGEQAQIQAVLSADYSRVLMLREQVGLLARLETAFWNLSKQLTGEPEITQLKLKNWDEKYLLAQQWAQAGQPDVTEATATGAWAAVVSEAGHRVDALSNPNLLIAAWLQNGFVWTSLLNWYYYTYEPARRGEIYAAVNAGNKAVLEQISAELEAALLTAAQAFIAGLEG